MENNKLQSMTDFVLDQYELDKGSATFEKDCYNYANFLKQPLEFWMFVPCKLIDGVWTILEKPLNYNKWLRKELNTPYDLDLIKYEQYKQAKERVLFDGFHLLGIEDNIIEIELKNADLWITFIGKKVVVTNQFSQQYSIYNIEDLIQEDLTLTETAIKQIYENN